MSQTSLTQGDVKVDRVLSYTWTEDEGQEHYLRAGDRVLVKVGPELEYYITIRSIEKGEDDASLDISSY